MSIFCKDKKTRGFTLIELLVSVAIFAIMTGLLMAKYGNFNQSVLLTNLAYDVALTIRTAQTYGLSVKSVPGASEKQVFTSAYGVHFNSDPSATTQCATKNVTNAQFVLFADLYDIILDDPDEFARCNDNDAPISSYSLKRGAIVSGLCVGDSVCGGANNAAGNYLSVTFKRPDPRAIICDDDDCDHKYAEIEVEATDGGKRIIQVRSNGQISVQD